MYRDQNVKYIQWVGLFVLKLQREVIFFKYFNKWDILIWYHVDIQLYMKQRILKN